MDHKILSNNAYILTGNLMINPDLSLYQGCIQHVHREIQEKSTHRNYQYIWVIYSVSFFFLFPWYILASYPSILLLFNLGYPCLNC